MASRKLVYVLISVANLAFVMGINPCKVCNCKDNGIVDCDSKGLTEIPDDLPPETRVLFFRNNRIANLTKYPYQRLQELHLENNDIHNIADDMFMEDIQLEVLNLAGNKLGNYNFHADTFKKLADLKVLNLSSNGITELHSEAFFHGYLSNLRTLDLSNNRLQFIDPNAFSDIQTLSTIYLQNNNLTSLSKQFQGLTNLANVIVNRNRLTTLPDGLFSALTAAGSQSGVHIDVSLNRIRHVSQNAFQGMAFIAVLNLSHNSMPSIPFGAIARSKVQRIDQIILDFNNISTVAPPVNSALPNDVRSISLQNLDNLTIVQDNTFSSFKHLESIEINNNGKLTRVENDAFLNISAHVRHVSFVNNNLRTLSGDMLPWQRLDFVNISNNNWRCDSAIVWMKKLFPKFSNTTGPVICSSPPELRGKNILDIPDSDFGPTPGPPDGNGGVVTLVICLVAVLVPAAAALLIYKFRHRLFYRRPGKYKTIHNSYTFGGQETIAQYDGDETASLTNTSNGPVNL